MHYLCVILKARQLGFSSFILIFMLDQCLFNKNTRCGIIDVKIDDATKKMEKIKFAYARLPEGIRKAVPIKTANVTTLQFANGSSIEVGTSHRGGTLQYLHISEFGKICAKFPDKAREIATGALNTIQAGQVAFIESTAEGQDGRFFELCEAAQAKQRMGTALTPLDFKFFFYPWWQAPEYRLAPDGIAIPEPFRRYFARLDKDHGIRLDASQKAWYVKKAETQQDDMKREYPSYPAEAFEASVEGAILGPWMEAAEREGRIGVFPAIAGVPVHTFWDIGRRDYTSIVFAQILVGLVRIVGFYQNCLAGMPHYAEVCLGSERTRAAFPEYVSPSNVAGIFTDKGWVKGEDLFPHDAKVTEWGSDRSRIEQLKRAGFLPKLGTELSLHDGINASRATLPLCQFDQAGCGGEAKGGFGGLIKILKSYRWEWDDQRSAWRTGTPRHDTNSHGADAFRTLATSWRDIVPALPVQKKPTELVLTADAQGVVHANMSVREHAMAKMRKRLAERD